MNLPDQPTTSPAPRHAEHRWSWRLEDASGEEVTITGALADQRFPSQGDAETWVGETWSELAALGVDAVVLYELDRRVYGPMSLHP